VEICFIGTECAGGFGSVVIEVWRGNMLNGKGLRVWEEEMYCGNMKNGNWIEKVSEGVGSVLW
jgi:hypothetical protein